MWEIIVWCLSQNALCWLLMIKQIYRKYCVQIKGKLYFFLLIGKRSIMVCLWGRVRGSECSATLPAQWLFSLYLTQVLNNVTYLFKVYVLLFSDSALLKSSSSESIKCYKQRLIFQIFIRFIKFTHLKYYRIKELLIHWHHDSVIVVVLAK